MKMFLIIGLMIVSSFAQAKLIQQNDEESKDEIITESEQVYLDFMERIRQVPPHQRLWDRRLLPLLGVFSEYPEYFEIQSIDDDSAAIKVIAIDRNYDNYYNVHSSILSLLFEILGAGEYPEYFEIPSNVIRGDLYIRLVDGTFLAIEIEAITAYINDRDYEPFLFLRHSR